jgi:S1-C subfamily serine protease
VRRAGAAEPASLEIAVAEHPGVGLLRTRLGVEVEPAPVAQGDGVSLIRFRVRKVVSGGPADRIALRANDVFDSLAGVPLGSAEDAADILRDAPSEQGIPVRVFRFARGNWEYADAEMVLD